jgi:dipeptidyl aminopeptidase/acylaminoacyl peptidase
MPYEEKSVIAPYGTWVSPLSAEFVASAGLRLHDIQACGNQFYWSEDRPLENGRCAICKVDSGGGITDVTPIDFDARSTVHEYGGGAWAAWQDTVFASEFSDQHLYRISPGESPVPITSEVTAGGDLRYADATISADGNWLVCIRESHEDRDVRNELVVIQTDGTIPPRTIAAGRDFYASPRLSPDGEWLAWLEWNHPQMPWDGTELKMANFRHGSLVGQPATIAGGTEESIFQPEWSPDGVLHFVSDRTGWWNLYALEGAKTISLAPASADFGAPAWALGLSTYTFLAGQRIACLYTHGPVERLGVIDRRSRDVEPVDVPFTTFAPWLCGVGEQILCIAGSATVPYALRLIDPGTRGVRTIRESSTAEIDPAYLSVPKHVDFSTGRRERAFALYYPPTNPRFRGPEGELPPLVVFSHGGPTAKVIDRLNPSIQYLTSRGIGVAEVEYRGSSGRGREFRQRLRGEWGEVDVEDCVNAARYLAASGEVDPARMAIRGGSAGGYTALRAITRDTFAGCVSYYGISDLEALARQTHKFESQYLTTLIGPYPEAIQIFRERSPINHSDELSRPILILQGINDKVVPLAQAEAMVAVLEARRVPYAYLAFEGESHGFQRADSIARAAAAELYFYSRVFGFSLADPVDPIPIHHLDSRSAEHPRKA